MSIWSKTGIMALSVFPVPVGAIRMRFRPEATRGIARFWISESSSKPRDRMQARILSSRFLIGLISLQCPERSEKGAIGQENLG